MPPPIATLVFIIGVLGVFFLDRDPEARTSKALWLPVFWLLINGSRSVSMWLGAQTSVKMDNPDQYLDGSPLDALIYSALLGIAVGVLFTRGQKVARLLQRNAPIVFFFTFCAVSSIWSDYSEVSFKRWIKAMGDLVMVLVVLTDAEPIPALKRVLARVGVILIPASVLLIKYYPALGRMYNIWTWEPTFVGVTDHKNTLGMICMILGTGFVWRFLLAFKDKEDPKRGKRLIAWAALIGMAIWLFIEANSMTALSCFLIATAFMIATGTKAVARKTWLVPVMMIAFVSVPIMTLFLGIGGGALEGMGRDATLTGRTDIWKLVIGMSGNPLLGTGFESFWLGSRASRMWQAYYFHPTQAHNGYIEVYLELGWIGIALLASIIVAGYRNALSTFKTNPDLGRIRLTYILIALIYNMTEAGFRLLNLTWFFFLLSATIVATTAVTKTVSSEQEVALPQSKESPLIPWREPREPVTTYKRKRFETV